MAKKKVNLNELKQTHAQGEIKPKKLSEIIARSQGVYEENMGPYKTRDVAEYEEYLRNLSRADLDAHAEKVGVIPAGDSRMVARKLATEFKRFWQAAQKTPEPVKFTEEQKNKFKAIKFSE